jgi:hypothetical protein
MNFKKGDYVVLLNSWDGKDCWKDMPVNYCYRLSKDSNLFDFTIELDIDGYINNGWDAFFEDSKLNFRLATNEEINEYIKFNKPFNVTTLKSKLNNYTKLINMLKYINERNRTLT